MDGLTLLRPGEPATEISAEEREHRRAADAYARTSIRLEGLTPSAFSDEMTRRYNDGEITRAELTAAIRAHHGL